MLRFYGDGAEAGEPIRKSPVCSCSKRKKFTYLWMIKKEKWIYGPGLPQEFPKSHFCSTALDSTSVIFIGGYLLQDSHYQAL